MKKDFDQMAKVAVIGDSAVGKTNLLLRFINDIYHQNHLATIGIDFKVKTVEVNGIRIKLQIWDTAGQERFRHLTGTIYQGAEAVILTYAIDNRRSFQDLSRWIEDAKNYAKKDVVLGIVGNKCDLKVERAVPKKQGQLLANKVGAIFYETSALENINVQEVFRSIAEHIHRQIQNRLNQKKSKSEGSSSKLTEKSSGSQFQKSEKQVNNNGVNESKSKMTLNSQKTQDETENTRKRCC